MTPHEIATAIRVAVQNGHHPIGLGVTAGDILQEATSVLEKVETIYLPAILAVLKEL